MKKLMLVGGLLLAGCNVPVAGGPCGGSDGPMCDPANKDGMIECVGDGHDPMFWMASPCASCRQDPNTGIHCG